MSPNGPNNAGNILSSAEVERVVDLATAMFEKDSRLDAAVVTVEGKGQIMVPCPTGSCGSQEELNMPFRERVKAALGYDQLVRHGQKN